MDYNIKVAKGRAEKGELQKRLHGRALNSAKASTSVGDMDSQDRHVFGPSGSVSLRYGSGSFPFLIKVLSGLK